MSNPLTATIAAEPVGVGGAIVAFVTAVLAALPAFGVALSPEQYSGALGVTTALVALVSVLVRRKVTPA